jgi:membrane protease YdiL (CAAX protease family)
MSACPYLLPSSKETRIPYGFSDWLSGHLLINLWEEAAWAGFLQTRLERRHNFFLAALLTGIQQDQFVRLRTADRR